MSDGTHCYERRTVTNPPEHEEDKAVDGFQMVSTGVE